MPNKAVEYLLDKVQHLDEKLNEHLVQSGGIQAHLKFNTWLTGVILVALLTKFMAEWFKGR